MLPVMCVLLSIVFYKTVKYSKKTNHMVHQVLLDPTGTEATFVYKNYWQRKLRADRQDEVLMLQHLANPP